MKIVLYLVNLSLSEKLPFYLARPSPNSKTLADTLEPHGIDKKNQAHTSPKKYDIEK